jgi:hypothetical protein
VPIRVRDQKKCNIQSMQGTTKLRPIAEYPYRAYNFVFVAPVTHCISTPKWPPHRPVVYISHLLYLLSKMWHQRNFFSKYRHSYSTAPVALPLQTFAQPPVWQAWLCSRSAQYSLFGSTFNLSLVVFKEQFLWLTMQVSFTVQQAGGPSFYC